MIDECCGCWVAREGTYAEAQWSSAEHDARGRNDALGMPSKLALDRVSTQLLRQMHQDIHGALGR